MEMKAIGSIRAQEGFAVELADEYATGLSGLRGFSHVVVLWHPHEVPDWDGSALTTPKPYRLAPDSLGIFATRSPWRPNGIAMSVAEIVAVDEKKGTVSLAWIDADHESPVLDIKPYHPSSDRIRDARVPDWCAHWPACYEESGAFDWEGEFLFPS